jgi:hypothetical protein
VTDSIFLMGNDGKVIEAPSKAFVAEVDLQEILADNLHLLPGALINPDEPRRWELIQREAGIPDRDGGSAWWALDHLAVDQDAVPTFIEVKRASDTRARREVVAQMLDYAANGSLFWTADQLRGWFEGDDVEGAAHRLGALLGTSGGEDPGEVATAFWDTVQTNLREGHVRLVFVADQIPASLKRLVEFMNEQMPRVEVLAVEIRQYAATGGQTALVPRLIGDTARAQATKEAPARSGRRAERWTVEATLGAAGGAGPGVAAAAETIAAWVDAHPHLTARGGRGANPSFIVYAGIGPATGAESEILTLWTAKGDIPQLEIQIRKLLGTAPYDRSGTGPKLIAELRTLGIPRLDSEKVFAMDRPSIRLSELTDGRLEQLLAVVDRWIETVRQSAGLS